MKYLYLLIITFCISCKKNKETTSPPDFEGTVTAELNGEYWEANSVVALLNFATDEGINMRFRVFDGNFYEKLTFIKVPFVVGTYPLENANSQEVDGKVGGFYSFNDYDVVLAFYKIVEADSSSYITLESYDEATQEVRGTFDATLFLKSHYDTANEYPDTLRFKNGVFHAKIRE